MLFSNPILWLTANLAKIRRFCPHFSGANLFSPQCHKIIYQMLFTRTNKMRHSSRYAKLKFGGYFLRLAVRLGQLRKFYKFCQISDGDFDQARPLMDCLIVLRPLGQKKISGEKWEPKGLFFARLTVSLRIGLERWTRRREVKKVWIQLEISYP